jgi:hypothetical protein
MLLLEGKEGIFELMGVGSVGEEESVGSLEDDFIGS